MDLPYLAATTGSAGVLGTAFALGLRHGADWDHIAALMDISGIPARRRRSMFLCLLYALGHASVLIALGTLAILFGRFVPPAIEETMGRIVGLTLILLGAYLLITLIRNPDDFRPRGRFALLADGLDRLRRKGRYEVVEIEHEHAHDHGEVAHRHDHPPTPVTSAEVQPVVVATVAAHSHRHTHRQVVASPDAYGSKGAFSIGMLHGVGAETPTQVLVMVTAAGLGGRMVAMGVLLAFVAGLLLTNTVIAAMATYGVLRDRSSFLFKTVGLAAGVFSLVYGISLVTP